MVGIRFMVMILGRLSTGGEQVLCVILVRVIGLSWVIWYNGR